MDPHSRHLQFNQRTPKLGPQTTRHMDAMSYTKPFVDTPLKYPISPKDALATMHGPTTTITKQDGKIRKDMYLSFIINALQQRTVGDSEPFDELVGQFNSKRIEDVAPQLRLWLSALSHVVSRFERQHAPLVDAIVSMPWATLDSGTVRSYTIFIGMLVSARPEYLSLVLNKITLGFTYLSGPQLPTTDAAEGSSAPLTRRIVYDRLHTLLRYLLELIPTLPSALQPQLIRHFPHKRQSLLSQVTYIRNLLRVSAYCPELAHKILATIVDRAIQIDVEIQVELEDLEEDHLEDEDLFELDPFDTIVGQEGEADMESEDEDEGNFSDLSSDAGDMAEDVGIDVPSNVRHIRDMVKKLDAILTVLFDHFHRSSGAAGLTSPDSPSTSQDLTPLPPLPPSFSFPKIDNISPHSIPVTTTTIREVPPSTPRAPTSLRDQFHALLAIFDRTILHTFKSRYTQFLLFWVASRDSEFADIFQGLLVERALFQGPSADTGKAQDAPQGPGRTRSMNIGGSTVTRAAAASYIGSFVSRATFVDRVGTRRVVSVLCEFLHAHLECMEELMRDGADTGYSTGTQNVVFYAVTQAVFLIFCFRWRDLLDEYGDDESELERGGKKWMPVLGILQRVITSVLNPLRVCSSNVVTQFARIAHATDFLYCYTILEANRRSGGPDKVMVMGEEINAELNTFFPFDPYRLPKSCVYVRDVYREWSSVAIGDDDDEDEEGDGEDENEQEISRSNGFLDIPKATAKNGDDPTELGASLEAMSISPVRYPSGHSVVMGSFE